MKKNGNKDYIYPALYVSIEHLWVDTKGTTAFVVLEGESGHLEERLKEEFLLCTPFIFGF